MMTVFGGVGPWPPVSGDVSLACYGEAAHWTSRANSPKLVHHLPGTSSAHSSPIVAQLRKHTGPGIWLCLCNHCAQGADFMKTLPIMVQTSFPGFNPCIM